MTPPTATVDASTAAGPQALRFGRCVLHPHTRELWRDGEPVEVQRLALDVLLYLVAHPERDIPKEELLRKVWGEAEVTESVIARAVMKLRRAIGDEQQPPALLRTVHGVGYRWLVAPQPCAATTVTATPSALPQVCLAVLPLEMPTSPELAWAQEGLPALLGHLLGAHGQVRLVDATQLQQADLPQASWPSRAANVRAALGANWVLQARLERQAGALQLHLYANPDLADAPQQRFANTSVPGLAEQAAAWLNTQWSATPETAQALEATTLELLARSSHDIRHGHLAQAEALLLEAQALNPQSPVVCLELALVLRLTGKLAMAEAAAERAWALIHAQPPEQRPAALAFKVRLNQAMLAAAAGQMQRARGFMDMAEPLAQALPGRHERAEGLLFSGHLAQFMGDSTRAIAELESAVSLLAGSDDVLLQVRARLRLADALGDRGLVTRASELVQRAQQLLSRFQAEPTRASVQLFSAALHKRRRHFSLALAQFDQVRAVYEQVGHAPSVWYCRVARLEPLMELGQLSRAEQEARELLDEAQQARARGPLPLPDTDLLIPMRLAQILWLRGEHQRGLEQSLEALWAATPSEYLRSVLLTHEQRVYSQCLALDWQAQAARVRQQMKLDGNTLLQARLEAIQAMAAQDTSRAVQVLQEAWDSGPSYAAARMDAAIDLVWLALAKQLPIELESLMAHIDDECDEYLPAIVVRARFLDHQGHRANALAELQRVRQMHAESALTLVNAAIEALQQGRDWPEARSLLTEAVRD